MESSRTYKFVNVPGHFVRATVTARSIGGRADQRPSRRPDGRAAEGARMSRILITGGAGFIGSHLAEQLMMDGCTVYILDNMATASERNLDYLKSLSPSPERLRVVVGSVLSKDLVAELVDACDRVFHLAAAVGVMNVLENRLDSLITNVQGTDNVLDCCTRLGKPVVLASTSEVYGKQQDGPLLEGGDCVLGATTKGRWSYAAAKLLDECAAFAYRESRELQVVVARLFNTVGPGQDGSYGMVVPRFVRAALEGRPLVVYGDGSQTRTFTHVRDVCECLIALSDQRFDGEIFNVGGSEEVTIRSLAQRVIEISGSDSDVTTVPYETLHDGFEDMQRRLPSTQKLRAHVGKVPQTSLDSIIRDVVEFERMRVGSGTAVGVDTEHDIAPGATVAGSSPDGRFYAG